LHLITLSDTYTLGRTRLHEGSACHRDLCLATIFTRDSHPYPGGIRTRNPSKRTTPDPHLSSHFQRDRRESSPRVQMAAWWGTFITIFVTPLPSVFATAIVTIFGSKFQVFIVTIQQITSNILNYRKYTTELFQF